MTLNVNKDFICNKKGNDLFNDALNIFYLLLYCIVHVVKDHAGNERKSAATTSGLHLHILFTVIWRQTYG